VKQRAQCSRGRAYFFLPFESVPFGFSPLPSPL
jgi:hypothetical protein